MDLKPPENPANGKEQITPKKWDYQTFREFLISQAQHRELLSLNEFPGELTISSDWHNAFNSMRNSTNSDSVERVSLVGYNRRQGKIYLPREHVSIRRLEEYEWNGVQAVNPQLSDWQAFSAKISGIEEVIGILHSHPPDMKIFGKVFNHSEGRLSAGDLYIALKGIHRPMVGVADGKTNSLAFKTKDSIVPRDTKEKFYDMWEGDPQPKNLDVVIAQKYKLALYKGNIDQPLKRIA